MQSGNEEVLRACIVNQGYWLATTIRGRRAVVAWPADQKPLFVDELHRWAYVDLNLQTRDSVPVLRDVLGEAEAVSVGLESLSGRNYLTPPLSGRLERKGEPFEYLFHAPAAPGAPVVVDGRLAGVVVDRNGDIARVVPIALVLDRIDYEELDPETKAAICRAEGIRRAAGTDSIHMEHLVYALGLIPDLDVCHRVEQEAGTKLPDRYNTASLTAMPPLSKHVREALENAIRERESPEETRLRDLYEGVFAVECGVVRVLIEAHVEIPNPTNAGYVSDVPTSDGDPFGVHRYARALCTVLAADAVKPPLSVGLFAPWGAGKTSFMKAMSDRFDAINALTQRNDKTAYRPNIVQLWFNAWHYAEQNLIASLADAVFEGLDMALTLKKPNVYPDKVDEDALDKLKELARVENEAAQSEKKLKAAEKDVVKFNGEIDARNDERTLKEIKRAGAGLSKEHYVKKVATALGADERKIEELLKDADDVWPVTKGLLKSTRGWLIIIGVTVVAALIAWISKISIPIAAVAPVLAVLEEVFRIMRAMKKAHDAELAETIAKKEGAQQRADEAKAELEEANAKKEELRETISGRTPRSLIGFVRERRTSGTYSRQLSVAAEAHRDFRRLSRYIGEGKVDVGRIVLYIDDLDRCPEDKVVEVLHAVHLLLAFDLFVVVVAVDSKWLLHSLKQYSQAFSERGSWRSTPLSYLEKIIQIPFTLDPMSQGGYANFIAGLTRSNTRSTQTQQDAQPIARPSDAKQQTETPQELSRSTPPPPVDPNPKPLDFSPEETAFMSTDLYTLMSSPRNTKRFANVYRFIRATLSSAALEALLDANTKPYEPLMILVALITNHPEHAADVLAAIERSLDPRPWSECVTETALRVGDVPRGERLVADFRPWISHVSRFLIRTG